MTSSVPGAAPRPERLGWRADIGLDAVVRAARGRLYLAKDARMPRAMFEACYPRLAEFLSYRDPGLSSAMSRRLIGT
jgi:hypothetical protein